MTITLYVFLLVSKLASALLYDFTDCQMNKCLVQIWTGAAHSHPMAAAIVSEHEKAGSGNGRIDVKSFYGVWLVSKRVISVGHFQICSSVSTQPETVTQINQEETIMGQIQKRIPSFFVFQKPDVWVHQKSKDIVVVPDWWKRFHRNCITCWQQCKKKKKTWQSWQSKESCQHIICVFLVTDVVVSSVGSVVCLDWHSRLLPVSSSTLLN